MAAPGKRTPCACYLIPSLLLSWLLRGAVWTHRMSSGCPTRIITTACRAFCFSQLWVLLNWSCTILFRQHSEPHSAFVTSAPRIPNACIEHLRIA